MCTASLDPVEGVRDYFKVHNKFGDKFEKLTGITPIEKRIDTKLGYRTPKGYVRPSLQIAQPVAMQGGRPVTPYKHRGGG